MLTNIVRGGIENLEKFLKETPADFIVALNYSIQFLELQKNLPSEFVPKDWEFLFEDEIEKKIKKYKEWLKSPERRDEEGVISSGDWEFEEYIRKVETYQGEKL